MNKKIIQLPKGGELEIFSTPAFLETIKSHFNLKSTEDVTDDHIRLFIYSSTKSALDKEDIKT